MKVERKTTKGGEKQEKKLEEKLIKFKTRGGKNEKIFYSYAFIS
jgi:hypothetical protein